MLALWNQNLRQVQHMEGKASIPILWQFHIHFCRGSVDPWLDRCKAPNMTRSDKENHIHVDRFETSPQDLWCRTSADVEQPKAAPRLMYLSTQVVERLKYGFNQEQTANSHVGTSSEIFRSASGSVLSSSSLARRLASLSALSLSLSWPRTVLRFFARRLTFLVYRGFLKGRGRCIYDSWDAKDYTKRKECNWADLCKWSGALTGVMGVVVPSEGAFFLNPPFGGLIK